MRTFSVLPLAAALVLGGCASVPQQAVSPQTLSDLNGQTVALVHYPVPAFTAMSADKVLLGLVGGVVAVSTGNALIANNHVPDPADAVGAQLAAALAAKYGARPLDQPIALDAGLDPSQVAAAAAGKARYVLDVHTTIWSLSYFPTNWTHYHVTYIGGANLIDTQSKQMLAHWSCKHMSEDDTGAPTYDQLTLDGAAGLKAQMATIANECLATYKSEMLKL